MYRQDGQVGVLGPRGVGRLQGEEPGDCLPQRGDDAGAAFRGDGEQAPQLGCWQLP